MTMQNKYKLEQYTLMQVLGAIKGYDNYKKEYQIAKEDIFSFGSKNYSEYHEYDQKSKKQITERVYISGGGYSGSQTENKALRLEALDSSHGAKVIKAVDTARIIMLAELAAPKTYAERDKIVQKIYESCKYGHNFIFEYAGINSIGRAQFYRYRHRYIYIIAENLGYICKK